MKVPSLFPWHFRRRCTLFPPLTALIYQLYLGFCKEGNVSFPMYVYTVFAMGTEWLLKAGAQTEVLKLGRTARVEWRFVPPGRTFQFWRSAAMLSAVGVLRGWQGQQCVIISLLPRGFMELLHLYQAVPWCHDNFLGGQQAIPYWGSVPFLSVSPILLFSIPQLPHGIGIFQRYDKVTSWPFYDSHRIHSEVEPPQNK